MAEDGRYLGRYNGMDRSHIFPIGTRGFELHRETFKERLSKTLEGRKDRE